ncbi:MAG: hypothetical protein IKC69_07140 [Clostridia bacterium]|nr:hypothetical protein [Clostridia bacterium]
MAGFENKPQYPKVEKPFSKEAFQAKLPKVVSQSTPEQMRQACLTVMRMQLTFPWVPSEDYEYTIQSAKRPVKLSTDTIYAGLPYVNLGSGSIYRVMELYDEETGVWDLSELKSDPRLIGNACSGAACIAWSRCVSSAKMTYTSGMTQLMGYVNVGPYRYMKELPLFIKSGLTLAEDPKREKDYTAHNIGLENGREVMYESYAQLQPADGVHSRGHVRMVSDVHVVRTESGEIDGEESYILYMDQVATPYGTEVKEAEDGTKSYTYHTDLLQADGTPVYVQGGVDIKVNFKTLFEKHYIPFTFKEFTGEAKYQKAIMRTNNLLYKTCRAEDLKKVVMTANYPISDAFITVKDVDGNILYKDVYRYTSHHRYDAVFEEILKIDELKQFENGSNFLAIEFQLYNGIRIKSWKGFTVTLCPDSVATELEPEDLDLPARLKAIPIAKESMTPDELRKICVDFIQLQNSFAFKLKEDLNYWVERQNYMVHLKKEHVHGGIPYVNVGSSSLYRWVEHFDPETGEVDMSQFGRNKRIFGNACSGGVSTSWARCITSAALGWTHQYTQANGVIPVGPYTYSKELESFHNPQKYTARSVCQENGEQTMYESYALVKPGDGLNNPGHIRMFTGESVVFRNPDGTIDGKKSYAICSEQGMVATAPNHVRRQKSGKYYSAEGTVNVKYYFENLYNDGYLPFTFKEFTGEAKVQKAVIRQNPRRTVFNVKELEEVVLSCNYPMSDFFYTVTDPYGRVVLDGVYRTPAFATYKIHLSTVLPLKEMAKLEFFDGNYKVNVDIQLYNGEKKKGAWAFAGTLVSPKHSYATEVPAERNLKKELAAIPVAKPGMSTFRLRQICLDYMKLQLSFPHKLSETVNYTIRSQKLLRPLQAGIVHGGLPYVTVGSGNLYRVAESYDEKTATLDASMDCVNNARLYGNACSGGAGTSWSRVVNSANFAYTPTMTWANGFLPVGPYKYSDQIKTFTKSKANPDPVSDIRKIIADNGEQTMFESYAAMLPADGVTCCGHVRMNSAYPTVVRNEDGTIDGEKSYTLMCDQVCYTTAANHVRTTPAGDHYVAQGGVDVKYTFKELIDSCYVPFTFKELIGEKEVDEGAVTLDTEKAALTAEELKGLTLSASFPISDVFVTVTGATGKTVFSKIYRAENFYVKSMALSQILPCDDMASYKGTLKIECQLYNGDKLLAFEGAFNA